MFDELSVAENIFMGHMPTGGAGLVDWPTMRERARELLARIDAEIPPEMALKRLSVAQKHLVEIARALSHEAQVVIMDEPTAALSANEIDDLFRIVAQLKAEGAPSSSSATSSTRSSASPTTMSACATARRWAKARSPPSPNRSWCA